MFNSHYPNFCGKSQAGAYFEYYSRLVGSPATGSGIDLWPESASCCCASFHFTHWYTNKQTKSLNGGVRLYDICTNCSLFCVKKMPLSPKLRPKNNFEWAWLVLTQFLSHLRVYILFKTGDLNPDLLVGVNNILILRLNSGCKMFSRITCNAWWRDIYCSPLRAVIR